MVENLKKRKHETRIETKWRKQYYVTGIAL
jgi:hypothetical protein